MRLNQLVFGFSSKELIKLKLLLKFISEFLQKTVFMFSNLWFSRKSTSSELISPQFPVIPNAPSFKYLPALPEFAQFQLNLSS